MSDRPHLGPTPNDWATHHDANRHEKDEAMATARIRDLGVLGYVGGFTLWGYITHSRKLAEIEGRDFFYAACDQIKCGDHMHVSAADGGGLYRVGDRGKIERMMMAALPSDAVQPKRHKVWANFYGDDAPAIHDNKRDAIRCVGSLAKRVAVPCWLVECEEGNGDAE